MRNGSNQGAQEANGSSISEEEPSTCSPFSTFLSGVKEELRVTTKREFPHTSIKENLTASQRKAAKIEKFEKVADTVRTIATSTLIRGLGDLPIYPDIPAPIIVLRSLFSSQPAIVRKLEEVLSDVNLDYPSTITEALYKELLNLDLNNYLPLAQREAVLVGLKNLCHRVAVAAVAQREARGPNEQSNAITPLGGILGEVGFADEHIKFLGL